MQSVQLNSSYWDGLYDWQGAGEEWSSMWGGSRAQLLGTLYPRISAFLPAKAVLEIAPGFGRWTQFLLGACGSFQGVDLSQQCVDACIARFAGRSNAKFFKNEGTSLECAGDGTIDLVFSFDSLVHATAEVMRAYVPEILRVLSPSGIAFIHHSNWGEVGHHLSNDHGRGTDGSADDVARVISETGGKVIIQEKINWGFHECTDCLTLFGWEGPESPTIIENHDFMFEGNSIRKHQSPYSKLAIDRRTNRG
jgi:SAM-dependent methyltransferase